MPEAVTWSVHAITLDHASAVLRSEDPHLLLPSASAAKILVLLAVARGIERGTCAPDEPLRRDAAAPVADSGLWHRMRVPALPLDDVARLVGAVSDNLATNVLLARLGGVARVAEVAAEYGIAGVALHDIVRDERTPADPPTLSSGTAAGYAELMCRIALADGIEPAVAARVRGWLVDGSDLSMVAGAFGLDPLAHRAADRGILLVNKTGTDSGVRVDVGFCRIGGRGAAYACLAQWPAAADDAARDDVLARMRRLGSDLRAALR